jgi:hypothetical protein
MTKEENKSILETGVFQKVKDEKNTSFKTIYF